MTQQSLRQTTCATCRSRECCSHFIVEVTGADVARIAQTLKLAPAQFVQALPLPSANPRLGFRLSQGGEVLHLALRKQRARVKLKPCVFLLSVGDGRKLCGLGELRPAQCQMFPVLPGGAFGADDIAPRLYQGAGCWRTWHLGELDLGAESAGLLAQRRAQEVYAQHVAAWNQHIAHQPEAFTAKLEHFLAFLMNRYAPTAPGA
jgi:Fe-S-cluster containining protein